MLSINSLKKIRSLNIPNLVNLPIKIKPETKLKNLPEIHREVENYLSTTQKIETIVNGKKMYTNYDSYQLSPIDNSKKIVNYSYINNYQVSSILGDNQINNNFDIIDRLDVFRNAADLIYNKYYNKLIAATIVGQGKTPYEAEIDVICEMGDFLNFNANYLQTLFNKQPISETNNLNYSDYIPLKGNVHSITPFNFSAIGGNLATLPILMGNSVFWKPSENSLLSNKLLYDIFIESGFPEDKLNFIVADPSVYLNNITKDPNLAAIMFTGSSDVFSDIYKKVGENMNIYNNYPRLIGETGGKNFHFIDKDCNLDLAIAETFKSAFNYSGQKCSACSRVYIPSEYYNEFVEKITDMIDNIDTDLYGLINKKAYDRVVNILSSFDSKNIIYGGNYNDEKTYFIQPTLIEDKKDRSIFRNEYFAPILSIHKYTNLEDTLNKIKTDTNYSLTGSIFSNDSKKIDFLYNELLFTCGNFYVNTKSTGAVVGQQPFGGMGKSGTNDKAGDINLLYRLCNQKNTKVSI